jgi:23S rRNA pseudoU1915 N3-methylase RlmH
MSNNPELERDYNEYSKTIERKAQEEINKIKEKITDVKKEAEKIGKTLEASIVKEARKVKKKVNTKHAID